MRTLKRDKKPLYVCAKVQDSEPQQFSEPKMYRLNTIALSSEESIRTFGENYKEYRKATIPIEQIHEFHEGDRCYIYANKPDTHDPLCSGCDFLIYSVSDSISQGVVLFKRIQNGER